MKHVLVVAVITLFVLVACKREERAFNQSPNHRSAYAMSEGQRLYNQMNCVGCHSHGGGGMGPALMDGQWLYGEDPKTIFETIEKGRDDGMPSYRARLSDEQIWQLVYYVRSLSGLQPMDAAPSRDDHMSVRSPPSRMKPQPITKEEH